MLWPTLRAHIVINIILPYSTLSDKVISLQSIFEEAANSRVMIVLVRSLCREKSNGVIIIHSCVGEYKQNKGIPPPD